VSELGGSSSLKRLAPSLLLWLLAVAAPARPQGQIYKPFDAVLEEIARTARWSIGPFKVSSYFQLRNVGYDSNIYLMPDHTEPVSDFTAVISLPTLVSLNYEDWVLFSLSDTPAYAFYAKQEKERSFDNNLIPELKFRFFRWLVLTGRYEHDRSRRRPSSEFDVRAKVITDDYRGSIFIESSRLTAFGFTGSARTIRYEDVYSEEEVTSVSRRLDRDEREGGLQFNYRIFSDTNFFLYGGYEEYEFAHPTSRYRDSYSYLLSSGVQFPLMGRIRGNISLGYRKLIPRKTVFNGYSGLVGNTSFNFRFSRFLFRASYRRDCVFTFWEYALFFVENLAGPGVSFYPSSFLRLDYDFRFGENAYTWLLSPLSLGLEAGTPQRIDRYRTHTASLVFRIAGNVGAGLTGTYWQRESNLPQYSRNRFFIGSFLTYEF